MKDRRKGERRSFSGSMDGLARRFYVERRKTVIKAGRRTGLVGEYYNPKHLIWEQKVRKEVKK